MRLPLAGCVALAGVLSAAGQDAPSRGQLLYDTHCLDCHTTQIHWRNRQAARDWGTLRAWVAHWQGQARLGWSDADVTAVTRYLNGTIYRFPEPQAAR